MTLESGLKFPTPAVAKVERRSPRVSESSDASTISDSSQVVVLQTLFNIYLFLVS